MQVVDVDQCVVEVVVFGYFGGMVVVVDWYVGGFLVGMLYQCWQVVVYVVEVWQVEECVVFEQFDVVIGIGCVVVQYVCMDGVGLFVGLVFVVVVLVVDVLVGEQFYLCVGGVVCSEQFGNIGWIILVIVIQGGDLWCLCMFDIGLYGGVLFVLVYMVQYVQFWGGCFQFLQYC